MSINYIVRSLALSAALIALSAQADVVTNQYIEAGGEQHADWGYTIEGLNGGSEAVVVFTKTGTEMTWTPPGNVTEVDYLVVAGGGGGGGGWGGGGGAGGMVYKTEQSISGDVVITVGAGGAGASKSGGSGSKGSDSTLTGGLSETAVGGGYGAYYRVAAGSGGSGGGHGGTGTSANGTVRDGASGTSGQGNRGGNYAVAQKSQCGAGGGGAGAVGGNVTLFANMGGNGGDGLPCSITGSEVWYAGGGGGGTDSAAHQLFGGRGGGGAGGYNASGCLSGSSGVNGLGGGGGGGGTSTSALTGGRGGSGVVVIRYGVLDGTPIKTPVIETAVYDGTPKVPVVPVSDDYEVVSLPENCVNAGEYDIVLRLVGSGKYWKSNGSADDLTVKFVVNKAVNGWAVAPVIRLLSVEDYNEVPFTPPTALSGGTVTCYYDNDPELIVRPTTANISHSVTYCVAESENYCAYSETYGFKIGYKKLLDASDTSKVYGYRIQGLGDNHDEVAVVFDNTGYSSGNPITYTLPADVTSVRYLVVAGGGGGGCCQGNSNGAGGGGGAGAALTNIVETQGGEVLSLYVGAGGRGATHTDGNTNNSNKKGDNGKQTSLKIGEGSAIVAEGGGGGGSGHSTAGSGGGCGGGACANGAAGVGSQGGNGGSYTSSTGAGSGGGGMGGPGNNATSSVGGNGGEGVECDIIGELHWYSGGGGGGARSATAGTGGSGVGGDGGSSSSKFGKNATYYGGGGGGNYNNVNSPYYAGNGYQGIVVIRYTESKSQNFWTVDPAISVDNWFSGDDTVVLTPGMSKFGAVPATYTKDGVDQGAFDGAIPTEPGNYVVTYDMSVITGYYPDQVVSKSISFTVLAADGMPPFTVSASADPTFAINGTQVDLSIAYAVSCDVVSPKTVDIHAIYWNDADATVTNDVAIAAGVALDAASGATVQQAIALNTNYHVMLYGIGEDGATYSATTQVYNVAIPGPSAVSANATFRNDPKEFVISGTATPGLGSTAVTVYWSVNSAEMDQSATFNFNYGDDGAFSTNIVYVGLDDTLTWRVAYSNVFGDENWNGDLSQKTKSRVDTSTVKYTWKGGSAGDWCDINNWTPSVAQCYGYPNSDYARVEFNSSSHTVNLGGASIITESGNKTTSFAIGGHLVITNGTLRLPYQCVSTGKHIEFRDGGIMTDVGTGGTMAGSVVFAQDNNGATLTLGGNATVNSTFFSSWYNGPNDVYSMGTNTINTQTVYCRGGELRVFACGMGNEEGFLRMKNFQNGSGSSSTAGGNVGFSVSNAVISINQITWNPYSTPRLNLKYFVPAAGFEAAPIQLRTNCNLDEVDVRLTLNFTEGMSFNGKWTPLLSGVTDLPMTTIRNTVTVVPESYTNKLSLTRTNNTLYYKLGTRGLKLILR